jgi:hypothetical protein
MFYIAKSKIEINTGCSANLGFFLTFEGQGYGSVIAIYGP